MQIETPPSTENIGGSTSSTNQKKRRTRGERKKETSQVGSKGDAIMSEDVEED